MGLKQLEAFAIILSVLATTYLSVFQGVANLTFMYLLFITSGIITAFTTFKFKNGNFLGMSLAFLLINSIGLLRSLV